MTSEQAESIDSLLPLLSQNLKMRETTRATPDYIALYNKSSTFKFLLPPLNQLFSFDNA